eukprot:4778534-Alexandrium_andersonii.AAC.1
MYLYAPGNCATTLFIDPIVAIGSGQAAVVVPGCQQQVWGVSWLSLMRPRGGVRAKGFPTPQA